MHRLFLYNFRRSIEMNYSNKHLIRERGPIRVTWVCLSEGYNGEYDPTNPEDELLLRFNLFLKDETSGDWRLAESRLTCFAAKVSVKDQEAALDILLDRFYDAYANHPARDLGALADTLSYISADTVPQYAGMSQAENTSHLTM